MSDPRLLLGARDWLAYRIMNTQPAHLIQYLALGEPSGTTARDMSGHGRTGVYTNVTLDQDGAGDGRKSAGFNGTTSYADIYSASLAAAFNPLECTIVVWVKAAAAASGRIVTLQADANNSVLLYRSSATNALRWAYTVGGTLKQVVGNGLIGTTPYLLVDGVVAALSVSKSGDALKGFVNGVQNVTTTTALGVWAGSLAAATTLVGALTKTPSAVWSGTIAHVAIWDVALSDAEILNLGAK